MIKDWKSLTQNAKLVCIADFLWNLGRTLPHAILTVFLMRQGCSLTQIALLQSIFMVVAMLTEFPSGVWADTVSRKNVYLLSIITLMISYLLIGFFSHYFLMLCISYVLYGLSVSLKSGTLEAEVVLELTEQEKSVEKYSIISSYAMSISSIIGGLAGSFLYNHIINYIYFISAGLYILSFGCAAFCSFKKTLPKAKEPMPSLLKGISEGISLLKESSILKYILCTFAVMTLFLQPFFQYWQVLYQANNVSERFFGVAYILFQMCNVIGTYLYKKTTTKHFNVFIILLTIPIVYGFGCIWKGGVLVTLPISLILFYAYSIHVDIIRKKNAPTNYISSFFSFVGTIENVASIGSLFLMARCINVCGTSNAFLILFSLFAAIAMFLHYRMDKVKSAGQCENTDSM